MATVRTDARSTPPPASSDSPFRREGLSLPEDSLDGGVLKIGRIAVLPQNTLHQNAHPGARTFTVRPVDRHIALQGFQQFVRDDLQGVVSKDVYGALVLRRRVIEGDLILDESLFLSAFAGGPNVLREFDKLLQDLDGANRVRVVAGNGQFRAARKNASSRRRSSWCATEFRRSGACAGPQAPGSSFRGC